MESVTENIYIDLNGDESKESRGMGVYWKQTSSMCTMSRR